MKRAVGLPPFLLTIFSAALAINGSHAQGHWAFQVSGSSDTLLNVKAVNAEVGWAAGSGGCVLRTTDGGINWKKCATPLADFDNVCIEPLDSTVAWVVSIDAASGTDFRIFKTDDGSNSWKQVFKTDHTFGDAVRFFDKSHGIALGDPYPADYFSVYTTSDGGDSWHRVKRENIVAADTAQGEFGVTACMSVFGTDAWFATASQSKDFCPRVFHSTDFGKSWRASDPIKGLNGIAVSLEFTDALHGVVVDNLGGKWASTTDGGKSWSVHDIGRLLWLRDIKRVPGSLTLMIAGGEADSGYVFESSSGDTAWHSVPLPPGTKRIRSISFGSPDVGWAVGGIGEILRWTIY